VFIHFKLVLFNVPNFNLLITKRRLKSINTDNSITKKGSQYVHNNFNMERLENELFLFTTTYTHQEIIYFIGVI